MLDAPKNLTRNVLIAMFLGALIGAILYYSSSFSDGIKDLIFEYIFKNHSCQFSVILMNYFIICRSGGIGRRARLKLAYRKM